MNSLSLKYKETKLGMTYKKSFFKFPEIDSYEIYGTY